jgi:hypothetical protein
MPPDVIARAMAFAIEQPADIDVNEIVIRPTAHGVTPPECVTQQFTAAITTLCAVGGWPRRRRGSDDVEPEFRAYETSQPQLTVSLP